MKRLSGFCVALCLLLLPTQIGAQESSRPRTPRMTSDDMSSKGGAVFAPEAETNISATASTGSTVSNARAVLQGALTRMAGVRSIRTRLQVALPDGTREMTIENVKSVGMRLVAPDGEIVVVGGTYYYKPAGGAWQVSNSNNALTASTTALDYRAFLEDGLKQPGVSVSGKILGEETIDGVQTVAYEFTVDDSKETGIVQAWIGKSDGYFRRMFLSGAGMTMRIWCSSINENFTIQRPRM